MLVMLVMLVMLAARTHVVWEGSMDMFYFVGGLDFRPLYSFLLPQIFNGSFARRIGLQRLFSGLKPLGSHLFWYPFSH